MQKFSVTQFNQLISEVIDEAIPTAWIEGEVSRFKRYPSGHCYFTIKDKESSISAVIWSTYANKLSTMPKEGEKALFLGKATVFAKRGEYQFTVFTFQKSGQGIINQNFEELKKSLFAEGLFDIEHKKEIPEIPQTIAIVTGKDSAALSDVLKVLKDNSPFVDIKLFYTVVQGNDNDVKIIDTLKKVENYSKTVTKIDTVLLVRGGGSVEDLWVFNSEKLVRFIYNFSIPLISGIGHYIDYTLTDFFADLRASTPSVAASVCSIHTEELLMQIEDFEYFIIGSLDDKIFEANSIIEKFNQKTKEALFKHKLAKLKESFALISTKMLHQAKTQMEKAINRYNLSLQKINNLNPENIFKLGFAIIQEENSQKSIKSIKNLEVGSNIKVIFGDGDVFANISKISDKKED